MVFLIGCTPKTQQLAICLPLARSQGICIAALKEVFKEKWKTAFEHLDDRNYRAGRGKGQKRKAVFSSATVERLRSQKPKLAFLADKRG